MYNPAYLAVPIIWVTDNTTQTTHAVGTDPHDRLYLDEKGHLQYVNIQCMEGTEYGGYSFAADDEGHNPVTNRFSEEECCPDLTDDEIYEMPMVNPLDYAKSRYEAKIFDLDNWGERFRQELHRVQTEKKQEGQ